LFSYYPQSLSGLARPEYQIPSFPLSQHSQQSQRQQQSQHNLDHTQVQSISNSNSTVIVNSQVSSMAEVGKKESKDKENEKDKDGEYPIIVMEKALEQCDSDENFLNEVLQDFLLDCKDRLPKLKTALIASDHKVYANEAHAIKGAAANLALDGVVAASRSIEIFGKHCETSKDNPKPGEKEELLKKLEYECERYYKFIAERNKAQGQ